MGDRREIEVLFLSVLQKLSFRLGQEKVESSYRDDRGSGNSFEYSPEFIGRKQIQECKKKIKYFNTYNLK